MSQPETDPPTIKIVAALISDSDGRVLLVRKSGTEYFMQPGGKIDHNERPMQTLEREIQEELGCAIVRGSEVYLGKHLAEAANEPGHILEADLYRMDISGEPKPLAEIEELVWLPPNNPNQLKLAPFTRDSVLPLVYVRVNPIGHLALKRGPNSV